ncbi:MAG: hypothetical protein ACRC5A_10280 [Enterobacteriaceae bacterium]
MSTSLQNKTNRMVMPSSDCNIFANNGKLITSTSAGKSRSLSASETAAALKLFRGFINTNLIRVHNGKWPLSFGFQDDDMAMTPSGEMYFPSKVFKEDFLCTTDKKDERWFIHELVHAWQYQRGDPEVYKYTLDKNKALKDYPMEAQADLITDYYLLNKYNDSSLLWAKKYVNEKVGDLLPFYEAILKNSGFPLVSWR